MKRERKWQRNMRMRVAVPVKPILVANSLQDRDAHKLNYVEASAVSGTFPSNTENR